MTTSVRDKQNIYELILARVKLEIDIVDNWKNFLAVYVMRF